MYKRHTRFFSLPEVYFRRLNLFDIDHCPSGGISTALLYATECALTAYWRLRNPVTIFEQDWVKRVVNNLISRQKIHKIVKFLRKKYLFLSPLAFTCSASSTIKLQLTHTPQQK
ncbi:hypothetical protein AVEN_153082-1 [Araneus ventricosus]|uniref:Uncharacterized protein n=1 Tax=Araneus ventricosus TaxID=182803 RepID=A0A4Y2E6U4_ARAVE|nr:hypothetical protein AVEN_153082-1 [Araneus ventricosus]